MKLNDAYPGKYLKADDVSETGDIFTIASVELEELGQGAEKQVKPVVYFEEDEKGLVLNKTNFKTICEVTGQGDSDDWAGHQITLYQTEVQFGGDMVASIRVKKKVNRNPANTKTAAASASRPGQPAKAAVEPETKAPAETTTATTAETGNDFGEKSGKTPATGDSDEDIPF